MPKLAKAARGTKLGIQWEIDVSASGITVYGKRGSEFKCLSISPGISERRIPNAVFDAMETIEGFYRSQDHLQLLVK